MLLPTRYISFSHFPYIQSDAHILRSGPALSLYYLFYSCTTHFFSSIYFHENSVRVYLMQHHQLSYWYLPLEGFPLPWMQIVVKLLFLTNMKKLIQMHEFNVFSHVSWLGSAFCCAFGKPVLTVISFPYKSSDHLHVIVSWPIILGDNFLQLLFRLITLPRARSSRKVQLNLSLLCLQPYQSFIFPYS